jgi:uncharacterized membrane protein YgaE (UPF0421/DUF939 family)
MAHKLYSILAFPRWESLEQSARTAVAATLSLMVARGLGLPEAYWALISALVVTQSTLGSAWTISRQRFFGTAVGSAAGALLAPHFGSSAVAFGCAVLGIGLLCTTLRLEKAAYRFAGITLAIVVLAAQSKPAWVIAMDRFLEVSLGIAIALALVAVWPEREQPAPQS